MNRIKEVIFRTLKKMAGRRFLVHVLREINKINVIFFCLFKLNELILKNCWLF